MSSKKKTMYILDEALRMGFSPMPKVVLRANRLSMQAKTLYALLLDYAWQKDSCFPGQDRLAADLDIHKNTVLKHLKELRECKLIKWRQRGLNKTNVYYILPLRKFMESHLGVLPESHSRVEQEVHSTVNKSKEDEYKKKKHNQSLTFDEIEKNRRINLDEFDPEAVFLAQELNDVKSITYYQKLIHQKRKGIFTDTDIQRALMKTQEYVRKDARSNKTYLQNPPAFFVSVLKQYQSRRKMKEQQQKIQGLIGGIEKQKRITS